jgi:hypothetical protein
LRTSCCARFAETACVAFATFERRVDKLEHRIYAGLGRRAARINADHARGETHVRVNIQPAARHRLLSVATNWRLIMEKATESSSLNTLIPPGTLGRLATELRPYLNEGDLPLYPAESVAEWRAACRELAGWVEELARPDATTPARRATLRPLLALRLQMIDAWPFPTGDLLGTFPRALWSLWQPVTGQNPERRCEEPECTRFLPVDAHGNLRLCEEHRREHDRRRAARNRSRLAGGEQQPR